MDNNQVALDYDTKHFTVQPFATLPGLPTTDKLQLNVSAMGGLIVRNSGSTLLDGLSVKLADTSLMCTALGLKVSPEFEADIATKTAASTAVEAAATSAATNAVEDSVAAGINSALSLGSVATSSIAGIVPGAIASFFSSSLPPFEDPIKKVDGFIPDWLIPLKFLSQPKLGIDTAKMAKSLRETNEFNLMMQYKTTETFNWGANQGMGMLPLPPLALPLKQSVNGQINQLGFNFNTDHFYVDNRSTIQQLTLVQNRLEPQPIPNPNFEKFGIQP